MKLRSMRVRLATWCLLVLGVGMALFAIATFISVRDELMEGVHESLIATLRSCELFLEKESHGTDLDAIREEAREYSTGLPSNHRLIVRTSDGTVLFASPGAVTTDVYEVSEHVNVHGHELAIDMAAPLAQVHETLALLRNALLFRLPIMLAVALIGGTLIAKRALRPIDDMTADAEAIGMNNLSRRLVIRPTGDELERLGVAWNKMLDRLAASVQHMKRFTADAAHELRTPISIIRSTAELALRKDRDAASYRAALSGIHDETVHLSRLVDDLMWLSRYDAQASDARRQNISVEDAVRSSCVAVTPLAEERGVRVELQIEDRGWTIEMDPLAFRRLLLILLDNALKFTPANSSVSVAVTGKSGRARIEVRDQGGGIAAEHIEHIFERFYRADPARTSPGFGLGLSIAKAIVDMHSGVIGVEPVHGGSCFYFELPGSVVANRHF